VESPRTSREYHDTTALPFPKRIRKLVADEQFGKFIEVIKKLYVNIPLVDTMQVYQGYSWELEDFAHHRGRAAHRGV